MGNQEEALWEAVIPDRGYFKGSPACFGNKGSLPYLKTNINGLSLILNTSGTYNDRGLNKSKLKANIELSTLNSAINDTIKINIRNFNTILSTDISNDYFPTNINLKTNIEDIYGALLNFNLN